MITYLLLIGLAASDAGLPPECIGARDLVTAARSESETARRRIADALLMKTPTVCRVFEWPEIPDSLATHEDLWASDLLKEVTLADPTGRSMIALVAWWKIHGAVDASLPREVLRRTGTGKGVRETARRLLLLIGDPDAIRARDEERVSRCSEGVPMGRLGVIFAEPSVLFTNEERATAPSLLVVEYVCANSRAAKAGVAIGDRVWAIDGKECRSDHFAQCWSLFTSVWTANSEVAVTVETQAGALVTRRVQPSSASSPQPHARDK